MKASISKAILLLSLGISLPLCAQQQAEWLNLWQKDGTCVSFRLQEHPRSRLGGETMYMETSAGTIEYAVADIRKFTFGDNETGIKEVSNNGITVEFKSQIMITGAKPNTEVALYGLNGMMLGRYQTDADGHLSVPSPKHSVGVVLLKVGGVTYKIAIK